MTIFCIKSIHSEILSFEKWKVIFSILNSFSLNGNNLWYETPNIPEGLNFDPEVLGSGVGNGRGLDFQNDPSYRQYSLGIKASF